MQEHKAFGSAQATPRSDTASFVGGPEAWRVEVDQIIAAIHPRTAGVVSVPSGESGCSATLVIPQAPDTQPPELAQTEPGIPCLAALQPPPVLHSRTALDEQATSPAHPTAQASLRAACSRRPERPSLQSPKRAGTQLAQGRTHGAQAFNDDESELEEASTREQPLAYPIPPSPFAHVCNAEPRRGGWVFDSAAPAAALDHEVVHTAIELHRTLGPGLRPHIYAACLCRELTLRGLRSEQDVPVAVSYKGETLEDAFRAALLVEGSLLVDVQGVARVEPMQEAHLRTFLVHSGVRSALLINFHEPVLTEGIRSLRR